MIVRNGLALACVLAASVVAADPVVGSWKTQAGDNGNYALVSISRCGAKICGVLGQGFDSAGQEITSPNIGRNMIWDMAPKGDGTYAGGKIWAPDRDKTYNARMALSGNKLEVKGCVLGICRGQIWTRQN